MPRFVQALLLALAVAATPCAPALASDADDPLTPSERQWLMEHAGTMRLAPVPGYPPIDFRDEKGEFTGLSQDYIRRIEELLGFSFQRVAVDSFPELMEQLEKREVDATTSITPLPERAGFLTFQQPHLHVRKVIVTREDEQGMDSLEALSGKLVAMVEGYQTNKLIREKHPGIRVVPIRNEADGVVAVSIGHADAAVVDMGSASHAIQRLKISNLKVAGETPYGFDLAIASRKDWPELASILAKGLALIPPEQRQAMEKRWIFPAAPAFHQTPEFWRYVLVFLGTLAALAAATWVWRGGLRAQVRKRTAELQAELARRRHTEDTLRMRHKLLKALNDLNQMDESVSIGDITQYVIDQAADFSRSLGGYLHFINEDQETIRLTAWSSRVLTICSAAKADHYPVSSAGVWMDSYRTRKPVIHNDYPALEGRRGYPDGHFRLLRHLSVPVFSEGRIVAVAGVGNKEEPYDEHDAEALQLYMTEMWKILQRRKIQEELRNSIAQANAANRAKSEFLANMSHEIRTPLNGILGMLQLLQTTATSDEQRECILAAIRSSKRLAGLLSDILDLSRMEAGKAEVQEGAFDVPALKEVVLDLFSLAARDKGLGLSVAFDPGLPPVLVGDGAKVRQILLNLTGNAVKFTRQGSVRVEAWLMPHTAGGRRRVLFTVSDTGPGIADDQAMGIFEPFVQGESSYARNYQGAGLGLSIAARLVRLLGGELSMETREGEGTTMYLSVPLRLPPGDAPAAPAPREAGPGTGLRILYAEDDSVTRLSVKRLLEKAGHTVDTAMDGTEALRMLGKQPFDLVLMDIQMPEMDGVEATRAIRAQESFKSIRDIPIIAVTAYAMSGDRERFLEAGMDDYIAKPLDIEALKGLITRVAER